MEDPYGKPIIERKFQCHDCGEILKGHLSPGGSAYIISPCPRCLAVANSLGLNGKDLNCKIVRPEKCSVYPDDDCVPDQEYCRDCKFGPKNVRR